MSTEAKRKERAESFATGRLVIGFCSILLGLQTLFSGQESYDQNLHELRKTYLPGTHAADAVFIGGNLKWEELNLYLIKAEGALFLLSGLLILLNAKCMGSFFLTIAVLFILIVKDNPWLRHSALKSLQRERNEKISDFLKNLSMLGSAMLIMFHKGSCKC